MHHFQAPAALLACILSTVLAVPAPAPRPDSGLGSDPVCVDKKTYNVAEQWLYYAPPKRETGASCSSGDAGVRSNDPSSSACVTCHSDRSTAVLRRNNIRTQHLYQCRRWRQPWPRLVRFLSLPSFVLTINVNQF